MLRSMAALPRSRSPMRVRAELHLLACLIAGCGGRSDLDRPTNARDGDPPARDAAACVDEVVARDPLGATVLAIDGEAVFWGTTDGSVRKRERGSIVTLATAPSAINALAVSGDDVYYATTPAGVMSVSRSGGAPLAVVPKAGIPSEIVAEPDAIYYLDYGSGIAAGRVRRVRKNDAPQDLITGLDIPGGIAVDTTHVYVVATLALVNMKASLGALLRAQKTGGAVEILAEGLHSPRRVALSGDRVYVLEQTDAHSALHGGLRWIPKSGGAITPVVTTDGAMPVDFTLDGGRVFLTTIHGTAPIGALQRGNLDGQTDEWAATSGSVYGAVRATSDAVYWTIGWPSTSPRPADGASVRKKCK